MLSKFVQRNSTILIILISAHSNIIHWYKEIFEKNDFDILGFVLLLTLGTLLGALSSLILAGVLWLSIPIYDNFKNGFEEPHFDTDRKHFFQDKIPLLIFFIVVFIINIITFISIDTTLYSIFFENIEPSDAEPMLY